MQQSDISRSPWMGAVIGCLFGCVLFVSALNSAGAGHGSYLPFLIYGAPLSIVPGLGLFVAPLWWGAVGWVLWKQRRNRAIAMLGIHTLTALLLLGLDGFRVPRDDDPLFWAGIAVYVVGLIAAWRTALTTDPD